MILRNMRHVGAVAAVALIALAVLSISAVRAQATNTNPPEHGVLHQGDGSSCAPHHELIWMAGQWGDTNGAMGAVKLTWPNGKPHMPDGSALLAWHVRKKGAVICRVRWLQFDEVVNGEYTNAKYTKVPTGPLGGQWTRPELPDYYVVINGLRMWTQPAGRLVVYMKVAQTKK